MDRRGDLGDIPRLRGVVLPFAAIARTWKSANVCCTHPEGYGLDGQVVCVDMSLCEFHARGSGWRDGVADRCPLSPYLLKREAKNKTVGENGRGERGKKQARMIRRSKKAK